MPIPLSTNNTSNAKKRPILVAKDLFKTFYDPQQIHILAGVCLEVNPTDTIAITGASGEGKSTLLQILGSLEIPTKGDLEIAGKKVVKSNAAAIRNKHIGFVFQAFHLLEDYTTFENVLMPARIARKDVHKNSPAYKRAEMLLKLVGLEDRASFRTKLLSGGEKQRVSIARALCNDPDILLADEPSGNLDKRNSDLIHELLINFSKEQGKGLIVVTHDEELASLCNRRFNLKSGLLYEV